MSRFDGKTTIALMLQVAEGVRIRLVLVCMVGHMPLMPSSPVH